MQNNFYENVYACNKSRNEYRHGSNGYCAAESVPVNEIEGHVRSVALIGFTARQILNEKPSRCMINVADFGIWNRYPKLFANAVICGITGGYYQYNKEGEDIDYLETAESMGIMFRIEKKYFPMAQECSVNIMMSGSSGRELDIIGTSLGHGAITIPSCILHENII